MNTVDQFKLSVLWKAVLSSSCFRLFITAAPYWAHICTMLAGQGTDPAEKCSSLFKLSVELQSLGLRQAKLVLQRGSSVLPFLLSWRHASVPSFAFTLVFLATTEEVASVLTPVNVCKEKGKQEYVVSTSCVGGNVLLSNITVLINLKPAMKLCSSRVIPQALKAAQTCTTIERCGFHLWTFICAI